VGLLYRTIWLGGLMFWATFVSHCVGRFYFRPLHPSAWAKAKIVNCVIQHEEMLNQKKKKNTRRCRHLYYNRASATHGSIKEKTTLLVPTSLQLQELLGSCCLPWLTTTAWILFEIVFVPFAIVWNSSIACFSFSHFIDKLLKNCVCRYIGTCMHVWGKDADHSRQSVNDWNHYVMQQDVKKHAWKWTGKADNCTTFLNSCRLAGRVTSRVGEAVCTGYSMLRMDSDRMQMKSDAAATFYYI